MSSQRLALVFYSAGTRWALPAAAILEVAPPPATGLSGRTRSGLPIEDFSELMGEPPTASPRAVTLVLDCAPPRALLVESVEEVADLATAPFFSLPAAVRTPVAGCIRGAVLHREQLVLELLPQALAEASPARVSEERRPWLTAPPRPIDAAARVLLFEAGGPGEVYGVPLPLVTAVVRPPARCRVPMAPHGLLGLVHHERTLLPVFDLSALRGGPPTEGEMVAALDVGGLGIGVAARSVIGVAPGFVGEPETGEGSEGGTYRRLADGRRAFLPDVERWFNQAT